MTSIDPHFGAAKLVRNQAIEKGAADPLPVARQKFASKIRVKNST